MPRISKWFVGLASIALVAGGVWLFHRSESDRIRDEMSSVVQALEFDTQPAAPARLLRLKQQLVKCVADPITIDIAPLGESRLSTDELIQSYVIYSEEMRALHITLSNIGIVIDRGQQRATAKGEAQLERVLLSGERNGEPRKFTIALEKSAQQWRVVHVRIAEPRIDQPEARP